jgi:hypothetical protein
MRIDDNETRDMHETRGMLEYPLFGKCKFQVQIFRVIARFVIINSLPHY